MFDWHDLKYFLAVAREGSTSGAARALQVDASTVQRRLAALEQRIGQPLVRREMSGYRLTPYGEHLLPHAQRVEQQVAAVEQFVSSTARELTGVIRLTCPEPLVARIVQSPLLPRLQARHPALRIEFVMSDHYIDLREGEADVALRSGDTTDNALVGRKIGDSLWAVYAAPAYLAVHGTPTGVEQLGEHAWVGLDATQAGHRATQWLRQVAPQARLAATSVSVLGMLQSARAGVGLAALPTALGDAEVGLVRVLGPVPELTRVWRMLTTRELRRTPRISAFFDFMAGEGATLRPILTG